jgi:multiple sugar transport system ATP-binding protein
MAQVSLKGISKRYDDKAVVLEHIDLEIADGELMVFVGPSGCGKSTLLRMIAGLEAISGGELHIGGKLANDVPPAQRGLAMVFQSYALYPHMSVYENMAFALRLAGSKGAALDEAVQKAAAILQIGHLLQRKPKELSGGQRQRVAIGRAIVRTPQVFLFDEPLSNLDASLRVQMRIEISRLHKQLGTTMIYVTHDQVEAMTLGQRIVVLNGGRIEQVGTPHQLYNRPANLFVAGFLGAPKMNFVAGLVESQAAGLVMVRTAGGALVTVNLNVDADINVNANVMHAALAHGAASAPRTALALGAAVTLGIRAEHLAVSDGSANLLTATVRHVEYLGDQSVVYATLPGSEQLIAARCPPGATFEPGMHLSLHVPSHHCHLFDSAGLAIE